MNTLQTFKHRKIALVTGGSRGIGRNIALRLAQKDIDVILTYCSREAEAQQTAEQIRAAGGWGSILRLDIEQQESFPDFFDRLATLLKEQSGTNRLDYLINNAGVGLSAAFAETTNSQFDQLMNIQFKGVFFFTQQALPYLNDGGGIVNISSRLAQAVVPGYAAYAAMKGAIETMTRYQARELAARGIRVNSIAPGPVATDFGGGFVRDNPEYYARVTAMTALGRPGLPEDIGGVVAFLCTEDARWITAQRIEVSGGMNL